MVARITIGNIHVVKRNVQNRPKVLWIDVIPFSIVMAEIRELADYLSFSKMHLILCLNVLLMQLSLEMSQTIEERFNQWSYDTRTLSRRNSNVWMPVVSLHLDDGV